MSEHNRSLGRLFLEALVWGSGFVLAGGALKLTWHALTSDDNGDDDLFDDDLDEPDTEGDET